MLIRVLVFLISMYSASDVYLSDGDYGNTESYSRTSKVNSFTKCTCEQSPDKRSESGVRIAIVDSGVSRSYHETHPEVETVNMTDEESPFDLIGHGTFSMSVLLTAPLLQDERVSRRL